MAISRLYDCSRRRFRDLHQAAILPGAIAAGGGFVLPHKGIVLKIARLVREGTQQGEFVNKAPSKTLIIPAKELVQVIAKDRNITGIQQEENPVNLSGTGVEHKRKKKYISRRDLILVLITKQKKVGEILGTLIKTFKAAFLPFFDELSSYLMPMWGKDKTLEERRIAICIFDDVAEQCREAALKYYDTYLPFVFEACNDENSDVRQAAVYGLGVCAEFGGPVFKALVGEALSRLNVVIRDLNSY